MAMQQCPNGHLYDDTKNSSCPFCANGGSVNVTVPLSEGQPAMDLGGAFPQTMPLDAQNFAAPAEVQSEIPQTTGVTGEFGVTIMKSENEEGIKEVRGWLVCLNGKKRGTDFRVYGERNTIGRGASNDIKLDFDNAISKGVNAIISYDVKNNKFFIYLGESKNNIYVNDNLLMVPVELKDYDIIEIGDTKLIFRTMCNDQFNWDTAAKEEK